jgi:hypothetical protein
MHEPGEAANFNTDALLLRWFDHWLKDSGEFADEPRVRILRWARTSGMRLRNGRRRRRSRFICIARAMRIRARAMVAERLRPASQSEPRDVFVYDPEVPVIAPGGPQAMSGPFDQAAHGDGQQSAGVYECAGRCERRISLGSRV